MSLSQKMTNIIFPKQILTPLFQGGNYWCWTLVFCSDIRFDIAECSNGQNDQKYAWGSNKTSDSHLCSRFWILFATRILVKTKKAWRCLRPNLSSFVHKNHCQVFRSVCVDTQQIDILTLLTIYLQTFVPLLLKWVFLYFGFSLWEDSHSSWLSTHLHKTFCMSLCCLSWGQD